jgi:RHS repeat-associated protein
MALITGSAFAAIPKVLPEFKNEKQLAEWREEMAAKHAASTTPTEDHAFYTGKPYVASTGSYAFKYRSYNPELARWTSEDPSGFPDGANNTKYLDSPTSCIDNLGLSSMLVTTISDGTWVFSVNYKLTYNYDTSPTLVGDPWLTGITNLNGIPAGYSLSIGTGSLTGITSSVSGTNKTWTGNMTAEVTLTATFGAKFGPFEIGPTLTQSVDLTSHWSVTAPE